MRKRKIWCSLIFYFSNIFKIDKYDDFKKHIKRDHYLWDYMFYIYNVKNKDETEFNGIESYVHEKVIFYCYVLKILVIKQSY